MGMYGYPYWSWRCRWFTWLPRWWWNGNVRPHNTFHDRTGDTLYTPLVYVALLNWREDPQIPKEQEKQMLESQAAALQQQLDQIKERLEELGKHK